MMNPTQPRPWRGVGVCHFTSDDRTVYREQIPSAVIRTGTAGLVAVIDVADEHGGDAPYTVHIDLATKQGGARGMGWSIAIEVERVELEDEICVIQGRWHDSPGWSYDWTAEIERIG